MDSALTHLSLEELEVYFLDALSAEELNHAERHLVTCETCAAMALSIHRSWEVLHDEMDPANWKDAYLQDCLNRGLLAGVGTLSGQLRNRLAEWIRTSPGRAEGLVRLVAGGLRDAAESATGLLFPNASFPALPAVPYREAIATRGPAHRSFLMLGTARGPQASMTMDGSALVVRFLGLNEADTPPLVFLIPPSHPENTRNLKLAWNKVQKEWGARAEVGQEDLLVAIGPQLESI